MPAKSKYFTYPASGTGEDGAFAKGAPNSDPEGTLVSVIVPIYNASEYLPQALESILLQTHQNLQVLCINDGSTDDSLRMIQEFAAIDPRIEVIDKQNEGYGATCNLGIEKARGKWVAILEPDDWIEPDMLSDMLYTAASYPQEIDVIKSPYWRIADPGTPNERRLTCNFALSMRGIPQPFTLKDAPQLLRHHPSIWSAIYRKGFLDENGIRFMPIPGAGWADNPFLVETLGQAKAILYVDKAYYCYRADTDAQERKFHAANPQIPFERWDQMTSILERLGITDEGIWKSHLEHGFMYMGGVLESHSPDDPKIHELLVGMFRRMDPELVFKTPGITPGAKRLYAKTMGLSHKGFGELAHAGYLANRAIYNLMNVGLGESVESVKRYLTKYRIRSGGAKQQD